MEETATETAPGVDGEVDVVVVDNDERGEFDGIRNRSGDMDWDDMGSGELWRRW